MFLGIGNDLKLNLGKVGGGVASPSAIAIFVDEFTDTLAAGSVNGTNSTDGNAERVVVDTGNNLSVGSDVLAMGGAVATGNPRLHYTVGGAALARAAGLGIFGLAKKAATNTGLRIVAWDTDTTGDGLYIVNMNTAAIFGNSAIGLNVSYAADTWTYAGLVLRTSGYHYLAKGSGQAALLDWARLWVSLAGTNTPLYPCTINQSAVSQHEFISVYSLPTWQTAAVDGTILTSPADLTNFTHSASFLIYATVTLPSAGNIELRFRVQDASNYWRLVIDSAGAFTIDKVIAGTPTNKLTNTGITNGMRVGLIQQPNGNIFLHRGETAGLSFGLDTALLSSTGGQIASLGTGGAITSLENYPWFITGSALSEVNAASTFLEESSFTYSSSIES